MDRLPPASATASLRRISLLILLGLGLAGCGSGSNSTSTPPTPVPPAPAGPGLAISGTALAGGKPLAGSTVQLLAAGTTGNGSSPTTLSSSATTDATGAFTIASGYTCPAASSQLYLTARGGALAGASNNPAIALVVVLGRCDGITATTGFVINEATTAATAWALSQFLSSGGNVGVTSTNTTGLANAVATALALAGNTTGTSPGPTFPATGSPPAPRINALANLLNACTASASADTSCSQLLSLTAVAGASSAPTNTLDAALNLVRHPGTNVAALFTLAGSSTAFSPTLPAAPSDWTLPLTFSGGGMNAPGPLAVDSAGNVWVGSYFGVASQFSPIGAPIFAAGITGYGLSETYGLAIDTSDNVWIANESSPGNVNSGFGTVTELSSTGQPLSGQTGFSAGGLNYPVALAIDPNNTTWVVDYGNSHVTLLGSTGAPLSGASGYFSNLFAFPVAIALDASHSAWIANMGGNSITHVSADGQSFTNVSCCDTAAGLALDAAGNVWVANYLGDSVSEVSPSGTILSSGYTAPSINHPQGIAIDGAGNVWVGSYRGTSVTELAGAAAAVPGQLLSPASGWAPTPASLETFALALDASGNIWTTNFSNSTITEIVGLAAPVKTPLSALPRLP